MTEEGFPLWICFFFFCFSTIQYIFFFIWVQFVSLCSCISVSVATICMRIKTYCLFVCFWRCRSYHVCECSFWLIKAVFQAIDFCSTLIYILVLHCLQFIDYVNVFWMLFLRTLSLSFVRSFDRSFICSIVKLLSSYYYTPLIFSWLYSHISN